MALLRDDLKTELLIPDLGVTMRTVMGAAAEGYKTTRQRRWNLRYKGALIGSVQVKDDHLKGSTDKSAKSRNETGFSKQFTS